MNAKEAIARLDELAERASRLPPPSRRDPEQFHEARSELAGDLRRLADALRRALA